MRKGICIFLLWVLAFTGFTGCGNGAAEKKAETPVNDAPASADYVAAIGGEKIYRTDFLYLLTDEINGACREAVGYPTGGTAQEKYDFMQNFLLEEKDGISRFSQLVDQALRQCGRMLVLGSEAREKEEGMTETQEKELYASIDLQINNVLESLSEDGFDGRDAVCLYLTGMRVNEYKRFAAVQKNAETYAAKLMSGYTPSEEETAKFYRDNEADYAMRIVRKIFIAETENGDGRKKAEEVYSLVKNEVYPAAVIAKGWSEEADVLETEGLCAVLPTDTDLEPEITAWAMQCTSPTEARDAAFLEVAGKGYYILLCESIPTYESSAELREAVLKGLRKALLWEHADSLLESEQYVLSDFNREETERIASAFLAEKNPAGKDA